MADFSLTAIFGMDSSGVKTELKSLKRSVLSFAEDFAKLGAAAGVGAFVALSKGAMELAGSLADASANIGINVESLQALQAQHKRNGVSNEELTKALEKTKTAVISAAEGDVKAEAALKKLGLASADLIKLPLAEQYAAIAKGAAGAKNSNEAFSAVADLLGAKVGPRLMGSLKELGEVGLPGVTKGAQEAGQVMSTTTIAALDKAGDAIDDFKRKATIWAGEIVVNFRTTEGLKLMGMQLVGVVSNFGWGIVDAITEGGQMIWAVFEGALTGVTNVFQDAMVDAVKGVAGLINKVLPSKFEINVGNLEDFKSSGKGIGDSITEAIAKTSPSTFKKDFGEAWDAAIAEQQTVVDELNAVDFSEDATKLANAGKSAGASVVDGAKKVQDAGKDAGMSLAEGGGVAAAAIAEVAKMLSSAIERTGAGYQDQSTTALQGVRARVAAQLSDAQRADRNTGQAVGGTTESFATSAFKSELFNIEKELAARKQFDADFLRLGSAQTLAKYGDANFNRYSKEMQDQSTRTTNALEQIARGLTGAGIIQPNR
jgi:hypothetical protein